MELIKGSLIEWQDLEPHGPELRIERVLRINKPQDYVIVIQVNSERAWPVKLLCSEIEFALAGGNVRILDSEVLPHLLRAEKDIKPSHRARRDSLHAFLAPLLDHDGEEYLLDPHERGKKISELSLTTGDFTATEVTIYKQFRRSLQAGCSPNAFLPAFHKCGAPGKRRLAQRQDLPKPGQRSALGKLAGRAIGVRITSDIERKFERGIKRFYKDHTSLRDSYDQILREYFYKELTLVDGKRKSILPPSEELPTFDQLRYWYEHVYRRADPIAEEVRRKGQRGYDLHSRATIGDPKQMAFGPGSLFQIDATLSSINLVSALNPLYIIGHPVTYGCMDAFSHAATGVAAGLEGPSWVGAMLALDAVMADKVEFCAEYGIPIAPEDWPIQGFPQAICADRGEFEGFDATNLVKGLGTRVDTTAPYRADWKGLVERQFGLLDQRCINFLPGRVRMRARGEPDSRLKAMLTLHDFRQLIIIYMLDYNLNFYLEDYRKDEFMIADEVERYPLSIWKWGVSNRGKGFNARSRDHVRLNILPRRTVTITRGGIRFDRELYYTSERVLREDWAGQVKLRGSWDVEVAFDPRTTDWIYLITNDGASIERCHLTLTSKHLKGRDFHETVDYFARESQAKEAGESRRQQSRATLHDKQDAVIAAAAERKEIALLAAGDISKSVLVSGAKEHRAAERQRERVAGKWLLGDPLPDPVTQTKNIPEESEDEQNYAAPSSLDLLRQQRESRWTENTLTSPATDDAAQS